MSSPRQFTKVAAAVWTSKRFRTVSDAARLLLLYMMTCSHQNSTGAFRAPLGYFGIDLGWDDKKVAAALAELSKAGLVIHDQAESEFFVRGWYRFNPPMNSKHVTGTTRRFSEIQSDEIRAAAEAEFTAAVEADPVVAQAVREGSKLSDTNYMRGGRRS